MQREAEKADVETDTIGRSTGKRKQDRKARLFERKDSTFSIPSILCFFLLFLSISCQVT
jgi:hypothetical protein